ncbi:MAG: TIGR00266 family protein [Planctomycetota bacterium]|jgi:uncharacterized protein (TIGR00266 family)|nr:TIGR00266 family protein [Planctomycetota bacterium]
MQYEILAAPSYSLLEVDLEPGQKIITESGAMAWMEGDLETQTGVRGGLMKGLKRKLLSGESFFQNTYTAGPGGGRIALAPGPDGEIVPYEMTGGELILEKSAYLASTEGVECDSKFDGFKGLLNEGFFVLRVTGEGLLFFNAYGDIREIEVDGSYQIDNGYAVAWEPTLEYKLTRSGRTIRSFLFSDQFILRFTGTGKLWVQSRSPRSLASWAHPFRSVEIKDHSN